MPTDKQLTAAAQDLLGATAYAHLIRKDGRDMLHMQMGEAPDMWIAMVPIETADRALSVEEFRDRYMADIAIDLHMAHGSPASEWQMIYDTFRCHPLRAGVTVDADGKLVVPEQVD